MKRRGFTLIELLAVIVILAIIALIATPIVLDIIADTKKSAAERTADNYIEAVETAVATAKLDGNNIPDGTYTINNKGNLEGNGLEKALTIEMNGNKPSSGTVKIKGGNVTKLGTKLVVGNYNVKYKGDKLTASEPYKGVLCKANTTKVTALVWAGNANPGDDSSYTSEEVGILSSEAASKYDAGVTYTCELGDGKENTFYVLETSGDNVSLIMSENLGDTVAWTKKDDYLAAGGTESDWNQTDCPDCGNNNLGPITANKILKERTSGWTKLDEDQITLPSVQQLATAGGDTKWNTSTSGNGFRSAKWLYSYTKLTTGTYGYWTSSPDVSGAYTAWTVEYGGNLSPGPVSGIFNVYGVRPVITISKSQLD